MSDIIPKDSHIMIIGSMKSGTSSLYDYLCSHPKICAGSIKEPEYFSENQKHGEDVEHYRDLFSFDCSTYKYTLDGSTGYTKYPKESNVPKNIFNYGISPKFIYIIRNPFDRISSHYNFMQKNNKWKYDIIDEQLIHTSNYFLQLEQYKRYFPQDQILLLDFDDLKTNPSALLKRVYDFLGLSYYFPNSYEVKNRTPDYNIERRIKKIGVTRLGRYLPTSFKNQLKALLRITFPSKSKKRELTQAEREYIKTQLNDDMRNLNELYGFDVAKWGFDL
jgi:hypothetical protein